MNKAVDNFVAPPCFEDIHILYQDKDILLIDKPSGLLSLSGKNPLNKDSVHFRLLQGRLKGITPEQNGQAYPSATLVHRLDFGTSGIMLVALNKEVNRLLGQQFKARSVSKTYMAMLSGQLSEDNGLIELPIAKGNFPLQRICREAGKPAITEYHVVERLQQPSRCRVRFTPLTGRTHQLRIHSREIGHPILGCDLYNNEHSEGMAERLLLHATALHFRHPVSGELMQGHSPCPF
ncbi:RluA family pseudouridine synthase [Oceanicoccus sagamiensis]|uniref:RNA pseudouridine synthase n=1 Tax=Oceanicoccus sagamiensis TaxID=716816 RepID=A0A1X9N6H7_9GAMM|nr:RluA family pseudouridine synthase [Oceanicoccus sagamiensis]ARN73316.1 RNA pseudouridine synthase [Oceanicoccus sagamiensis]